MNTRPDRQETLFTAALALPASERAVYLAQACENDPALRRKIELLLRAHEIAGDFLNRPAVATRAPIAPRCRGPAKPTVSPARCIW